MNENDFYLLKNEFENYKQKTQDYIEEFSWRLRELERYIILKEYKDYVCKYKTLCSNNLKCNYCVHKPDNIILEEGKLIEHKNSYISYFKKELDEFLEKPNSKEEK